MCISESTRKTPRFSTGAWKWSAFLTSDFVWDLAKSFCLFFLQTLNRLGVKTGDETTIFKKPAAYRNCWRTKSVQGQQSGAWRKERGAGAGKHGDKEASTNGLGSGRIQVPLGFTAFICCNKIVTTAVNWDSKSSLTQLSRADLKAVWRPDH